MAIGAHGIVVPLVRMVAETEAFVRVTHHPPIGTSGFGPPRAAKYVFDTKNYFDPTNDSLPLVLIIETKRLWIILRRSQQCLAWMRCF